MLSFKDKNVYYKYLISFALSSTIPLLLLFYLSQEFVFPYLETRNISIVGGDWITLLICLTIFLSVCGFFITLGLIRRLEKLNKKVSLMNAGIISQTLSSEEIKHKDEIGQLANSIEAPHHHPCQQ